MCLSTDKGFHQNSQSQKTQTPSDKNMWRRRTETDNLATYSAPATVHPSLSQSVREADLDTESTNHVVTITEMNDVVHGTERAISPQFSINSRRNNMPQKTEPNMFLPSAQSSLSSMPSYTLKDTNFEGSSLNQNMSTTPTSQGSRGKFIMNMTKNPWSANQTEANDDNSFLDASPLSSLCTVPSKEITQSADLHLPFEKMVNEEYKPSDDESPSPRNVAQDLRLFKTSNIGSSSIKNSSQARYYDSQHNHSSQISVTQMWPPSQYEPKRPHARESRQESSPTSFTSTSPVASIENSDGENCRSQIPHSPSMIHSQANLSQRRMPFHLKPRPNTYHQQKYHQGQTTYWGHSTTSHAILPPSHGASQHPVRTAPEILKTLLRKKACLYEPRTSRAIALLTWLVARKLALLHGYFSRQHLQSGVHAIVAKKINSGVITRTKVNRCMQVILNSCFYYIIPKPDGTEECGDSFRDSFKRTASDDTHLLKALFEPWNDLEISDESLSGALDKEEEEEEGNSRGCGVGGNKRQVLLCFNENVRSAEDVLNCHNDFIRDTAISSDLILTPDEWRSFFLERDEKLSTTPYLSFHLSSDSEQSLGFKENIFGSTKRKEDALGQLTTYDLLKFRTKFCCKRYEHDATLCRFAHVDVNKGWLRRDPSKYDYSVEMCPNTHIIHDKNNALNGCYINACKDGVLCKFAHSQEEVDYHPNNYKTEVCEVMKRGSRLCCDMRDICPKVHPYCPPAYSCNPPKSYTRYNGKRSDIACRIKGHSISGKQPCMRPSAPMLYLSPAPVSEFDRTLHFPGLHSLYRQNCATFYAYDMGSEETKYSNFGEDWMKTESLSVICKPVEVSFSLFGM